MGQGPPIVPLQRSRPARHNPSTHDQAPPTGGGALDRTKGSRNEPLMDVGTTPTTPTQPEEPPGQTMVSLPRSLDELVSMLTEGDRVRVWFGGLDYPYEGVLVRHPDQVQGGRDKSLYLRLGRFEEPTVQVRSWDGYPAPNVTDLLAIRDDRGHVWATP